MTDNVAVLDGYTKEIVATNAHGCEFYLLVKPDAQLDGIFRAWDTDEQEFCNVNGWLFAIVETPCARQ